MSVLVVDRGQSRLEVVTLAEDIHEMLVDFMQHGFGVKDYDKYVRAKYKANKCDKEIYWQGLYLIRSHKEDIQMLSLKLCDCVRAAYELTLKPHINPIKFRDYKEKALTCCGLIIFQLQEIVKIFDVDVNKYEPHIKAIDREKDLINDWRLINYVS